MKEKRLIGLFAVFLLAFAAVMGRLYLLATNREYAQNAQQQSVTRLELEPARGNIYDCRGVRFTGGDPRYFALSIPGESSYTQLFQYVPYKSQDLLYEKRNALAPFLIEVDRDLSQQGIYTYAVPRRYPELPIAEHLLGYVDGEGKGASGLEAAFDEELGLNANGAYVECITTARGGLLEDTRPHLEKSGESREGLVLTLDKSIQRVCEGVAAAGMDTGCILVLDTATARVLASVSMPRFDPGNVGRSIQAGDSSLLNRPLCAYNVGSVFKPILAAAALENGKGEFGWDCAGAVDLNGQVYHCAESRVHGPVDMTGALSESCNCFFVELGQELGGNTVRDMARRFGFGEPVYLAGGMRSAPGNLPSQAVLQDQGELANLSFGQGQLTAAPIQVAAAMNVIASDGAYRTPTFLERVVKESTGETVRQLYEPHKQQVIRPETAQKLREMLTDVVENGLGRDAKPEVGGAGGKTGTAQTGTFTEDGKEKMNYWFVGFYPAEKPKYTILVMQDGVIRPRVSSGLLFRQVCNGLHWVGNPSKNS